MISRGQWTVPVLFLTGLLFGTPFAKAQLQPVAAPYLASLELWSDGKARAAVDELEELRDAYGLPNLLQRVNTNLSGDVRVMIPILGLFEALHRRDMQRVAALDPHASDIASELRDRLKRHADTFMRRSRSSGSSVSAEEAKQITSRLWSSIAFAMREAGQTELCREWFERALKLDEDNLGAAMSLAALDEKLGFYLPASRRWQKIFKKDPGLYEAELRLALSEARSGSPRRADKIFASAAAGDGPTWVRVIAYQEWAQGFIDRDDTAKALEIVREGRRAAPDDEGLLMLHLWLLGDRSDESVELLAGLERHKAPDRPTAGLTDRDLLSPRARYNLWPEYLETTVRQWYADVESHLGFLAGALNGGRS